LTESALAPHLSTAYAPEPDLLIRTGGEARVSNFMLWQAAVEAYSALMANRPQGLLGERVVFGLAKARESLGQLAEARRGYEAVAAEFPTDALAQIAAGRAAELGRESTRQWYDWFGAQKIAPPAPATNAANPANAEPAPPAPAQPAAGQ
jgi:hypothetical protein